MLILIGIVAAIIAVVIVANWRLELFKLDLKDELGKVKVSEPDKVSEPVPTPAPAPAPEAEVKPQRARDSKGKFIKDNPTTPQNEAWEGGTKPSKPVKRGPRKSKK